MNHSISMTHFKTAIHSTNYGVFDGIGDNST